MAIAYGDFIHSTAITLPAILTTPSRSISLLRRWLSMEMKTRLFPLKSTTKKLAERGVIWSFFAHNAQVLNKIQEFLKTNDL